MKKIISVIALCLIISIVFSACSPQSDNNSTSEGKTVINQAAALKSLEKYSDEYGCFCFPGAKWGMSEEMLLESLDDEIEIINREEKGSDKFPSHNLTVKGEFLGREAYITYEFVGIPNTDFMPLQNVVVAFPMNITEFEDLKNDVIELAKTQNQKCIVGETKQSNEITEEEIEFVLTSCGITGEKMISDLPQEVKDGYNNYIYHLYDINYVPAKNMAEKERKLKIDYSQTLNKELSSVKISHLAVNDICNISFNGTGLTQPIIYAEAYAQLNS